MATNILRVSMMNMLVYKHIFITLSFFFRINILYINNNNLYTYIYNNY